MAIELVELIGCDDRNVVGVIGALMPRFSGWTIHRTKDGVFLLCITGTIKLDELATVLATASVTARVTTLMATPR